MCSKHKRLKRIIMKQKLLKVMIAFIAIVMPNLSYAQSQEAAGTYNGTLGVKVGGMPAGDSTEDIYIIAEDANHIRLEIRNFKFSVGGSTIELGDIIIPSVELQKDGNTIVLLPKEDVKVNLPDPIGEVSVDLNRSTIVDKEISLILVVETTYPAQLIVDVTFVRTDRWEIAQKATAQLIVDVTFEGTQTSGSGIQSTTTEKPVVYYNAEIDALIVEGAENQKYNIYNITGVQTLSGILNTKEINVTALQRGIYLIKIGDNTVKFIKK